MRRKARGGVIGLVGELGLHTTAEGYLTPDVGFAEKLVFPKADKDNAIGLSEYCYAGTKRSHAILEKQSAELLDSRVNIKKGINYRFRNNVLFDAKEDDEYKHASLAGIPIVSKMLSAVSTLPPYDDKDNINQEKANRYSKFVLDFYGEDIKRAWDASRMSVSLVDKEEMIDLISFGIEECNFDTIPRKRIGEVRGLFTTYFWGITVRDDIVAHRDKKGYADWENIEDVFGHEFGHFIDWLCGSPSQTQEFYDCWKREAHVLDSGASETPVEYFASSIWICHRFPIVAYKFMPQTKLFFDALNQDIPFIVKNVIEDWRIEDEINERYPIPRF